MNQGCYDETAFICEEVRNAGDTPEAVLTAAAYYLALAVFNQPEKLDGFVQFLKEQMVNNEQ